MLENELLHRYFFQDFQTQLQKGNTAGQLSGEDVFWNIYGNSKFFKKTTLPKNCAKWKQNMFFKNVQFPFCVISESIRNAFPRLLVKRQT